MFSALILGSAACHVLEMPVKLAMAGADYMIVQQIYAGFGPIGAVLEPAAIMSAAALAFLLRGRPSFVPALTGAIALAVALLVWVAVVSPVNPSGPPPGRTRCRRTSSPCAPAGVGARHPRRPAVRRVRLARCLGLWDVPARVVAEDADRAVDEQAA